MDPPLCVLQCNENHWWPDMGPMEGGKVLRDPLVMGTARHFHNVLPPLFPEGQRKVHTGKFMVGESAFQE
eukprot:12204481-Karenia_brevis.AAC.1